MAAMLCRSFSSDEKDWYKRGWGARRNIKLQAETELNGGLVTIATKLLGSVIISYITKSPSYLASSKCYWGPMFLVQGAL
ncbi:hypothetical protein CRENBAI_017674 [Crenichthys baileyi]|uniref:Uncharacterized protein n=1 Tax=Crenichthys baileyi TaxID=28760 RepID=A0AAV9RJ46_9TELE